MDRERGSLGRLGYSEFKDLIVSLKMWQVPYDDSKGGNDDKDFDDKDDIDENDLDEDGHNEDQYDEDGHKRDNHNDQLIMPGSVPDAHKGEDRSAKGRKAQRCSTGGKTSHLES